MELIKIKNYVKGLNSRLFLGHYMERRLVNLNIGYRDIVHVCTAETDLKRDLLEARYNLRSISNNRWIGITDDKNFGFNTGGVYLWTEIENKPFGHYWFQIKAIKFRHQEIIVRLKCIRYIPEAFLALEPVLTRNGGQIRDNQSVSLYETYAETVRSLRDTLSIRNVKEFVTCFIAFIFAVIIGSAAFINFLGNFTLSLVREMSILLKNSTPLFLGVLNLMCKIVGGFYILLAMFFKQSAPAPSNSSYIRPARTYHQQQRQSSTYYSRYIDKSFD